MAPLITGQPPVVVVSGGELAAILRNRGLTRTTRQANHAPPPSGEWGLRVGAAYTQTGVLAKGRAKGRGEPPAGSKAASD